MGVGIRAPSSGSQCCHDCARLTLRVNLGNRDTVTIHWEVERWAPAWNLRYQLGVAHALNLSKFAELNEVVNPNSSSGRFPTSITQYSCPGGPRYPDLQVHAPPFPAEIMPVAYVVDHLAQHTRVLRDRASSCTQLAEPAASTSSGSRALVGL